MHLTDDQLNEYLDNESSERPQIESHLAECAECAARLTALQALFDEIQSLPEVELTRSIRARRATPYRAERQSPRDAASFTRPYRWNSTGASTVGSGSSSSLRPQ